jgi:uncharacterized FlgJ-related protein
VYLPGNNKVLISGMDNYAQKILMAMLLGGACSETANGTLTITAKAMNDFAKKCETARPGLAVQGSFGEDVTVELVWQ